MTSNEDLRFQKWVRILNDTDAEMSQLAARKLGELGNLDAVPHLLNAMERRTFSVALEAARALGALKPRGSIKEIARIMHNHPDAQIQTAAAESLGAIGDANSVTDLKQEIDDYLKQNQRQHDRLYSYKRGLFTTCIASLKQIGTPAAVRIARDAESADRYT